MQLVSSYFFEYISADPYPHPTNTNQPQRADRVGQDMLLTTCMRQASIENFINTIWCGWTFVSVESQRTIQMLLG
jgi:hypothetical protein